jgi:hypothetical protein
MRLGFFSLALAASLCCSIVGQTSQEFAKKYPATTFLEIRPDVLMKADYNSSGEVCSIVLQPNHFSVAEKTAFIGNSSIDLLNLMPILDELAPPETRQGPGTSDGWITGGGMQLGSFSFTNIRINIKRTFGVKTRRTIPKDAGQNSNLVDYLNSFGSPEVVVIRWLKRDGCTDFAELPR